METRSEKDLEALFCTVFPSFDIEAFAKQHHIQLY